MQNSCAQDISREVERWPAEIWMFNHKKTLTEAAKLAGVSQPSLSRALKQPDDPGFVSASLALRRKFMKLTKGKVTLMDWPEPLEDCAGVTVAPAASAPTLPAARATASGGAGQRRAGARSATPEASLQEVR